MSDFTRREREKSATFATSSIVLWVLVGLSIGETPIQFEAHRGKDLLIEVKKPGYQSQFRTTSRTLSSIGTVDVIGAYFILLPLLGLLSSGAWKHDQDNYGFVLEPEK